MKDSLHYSIRAITQADQPFLWEMLYQAVFIPKGSPSPPREIVNTPELSRYVCDWGQDDDFGLIAVEVNNEKPIAAVWVRLLRGENRGYGYVDDETPELSIAVKEEYRGRGVGTRLLKELNKGVKNRYKAVSLSVSERNPALRMYERMGYEVMSKREGTLTMRKVLSNDLVEEAV